MPGGQMLDCDNVTPVRTGLGGGTWQGLGCLKWDPVRAGLGHLRGVPPAPPSLA